MLDEAKKLVVSIGVVTLASLLLAAVLSTVTAQPPATLEQMRNDPRWLFVQFDNGSTWYLRVSSVNALWDIPEQDAAKLGYRSVIYGNGFAVHSPDSLEKIEIKIMQGQSAYIQDLLKGSKKDEETDSR